MNKTNTGKIVVYVLCSYGLSWLVWAFGFSIGFFRPEVRFLPLFHYAGSYGPFAAGLLTVSLFEKKKGRQSYLKRIFRIHGNCFWYIFPVLTPAVLFLAAGGVKAAFFGGFPDFRTFFDPPFHIVLQESGRPNTGAIGIVYGIVTNWLLWSLTFGIGEEAGWRGFLFTRLTGGNNPREAAVITGLFWAGWHAPLFVFDPGFREMAGFGMIGWFVGLMSGSILLSWMTVNAKWSIIPAVLWHGAFDTVASGKDPFVPPFCSMAVVVLAVFIWVRFGPGLTRHTSAGRPFDQGIVSRPEENLFYRPAAAMDTTADRMHRSPQ
jgi:membrane protease YdiL (CAAX protease family)